MKKCEECGVVDIEKGHEPRCSQLTLEDAKKHLKVYFDYYQQVHNNQYKCNECGIDQSVFTLQVKHSHATSARKTEVAKKHSQFWHGKWAILKLENNELRQQIKRMTREI